MNASLTPIMEPVSVAGTISGSSIISDLCTRIAERLQLSCDLRATDAYAGYSAEVEIKLQLRDIDTTPVAAQITVGAIDPSQTVERIAMGGEVIAVADRSLERPVVETASEGSGQQFERPRSSVSGRFQK
jgi:hypothetical protein